MDVPVAPSAQNHPVSPRLRDAETRRKIFIRLGGHQAVNSVIPPEHLQTAQWLLLSSVVGHIKIGQEYLHAEDTQ